MHPINQVADFMFLGGQKVPATTDRSILAGDVDPFVDRINEEVDELIDAYFDFDNLSLNRFSEDDAVDIPEALDAAIDLAYVAFTLAVRLVGRGKAIEAWEAVARANLSKVDGSLGPVRHDENGKILKPEGFQHPDIAEIVNR